MEAVSAERLIEDYAFLQYINEDKSGYTHAKDAGYDDPDDLFLIGESGGFLLNINKDDKFINTHLFCEMANFYKKNGCYTAYKEESIPYRQLRRREEDRRKNGFTAPCLLRKGKIVNIRITGNHYNFLNYTNMEMLDTSSINTKSKNAKASKTTSFPRFIDAQFWTWHVLEFAERNGFNVIIDKTRRGGFSYMMASKSANRLNLYPRKTCINVAIDKKYLTQKGGLTDFTIKDLNFYENKTFFKRGILSINDEDFELGFKQPNGSPSPKSWNSALLSVSAAHNPDCAIGKDAVEINVEELSTVDNFDQLMDVTAPTLKTGSFVTGMLCAWGTATNADMQMFERNFYSPKGFNFMPFENVWDKDSRGLTCGYFKSYAWGLEGILDGVEAMDVDGNSNLEIGLTIAYNERVVKKSTAKTFNEYINYLGQYALSPDESFSSSSENIFSSEELLAWETKLKNDPVYKVYTDGTLVENEGKVEFKSNARIKADGGKYNKDWFSYIEGVPKKNHEHHHGCIRIWFHPYKVMYKDKAGNVLNGIPPNMYTITYDPVGVDKENKEITDKHSHNSIAVWQNPIAENGFTTRMVATYYGRPESLEEADYICYLLAVYYNCIGGVAVEVNRGETVSNFNKWRATKYLMKAPTELWDTAIKSRVSNTYGIVIEGAVKLEALRLLKEMLYSTIGQTDAGTNIRLFETIYDYQSILELKKWNVVGNYDRVSQMLLRAIVWKLLLVRVEKELQHRKKIEEKKSIFKHRWY